MTTIKTLNAIVKAAGDSGEFEAILSMPTVDRDGEIIDAGAFNPLPKRIPIDIDHGMGTKYTVGSGTPFYDGDVLKVRGTFASTALGQETRTLVTEGHVGFMSVAYMNAFYETGDDGIPHLRKGELLNAAITPIPSNREAAILTAKGAKVGARNSAKDAEMIQAIFDHAVELGAVCSKCAEKSAAPAAVKTADTDPEPAAADPAAAAPADVDVAKAQVELALAEAALA